MKTIIWFRTAAVSFVLFAVGHTYGFLHFTPTTAEGVAVRSAMDHVRFPFGNAARSYGDLYRGFGLFITATLLFSALVAWELPRLARPSPESFRLLAAGLLSVQIVSSATSLVYFALPQTVLSLVTVACLAGGMFSARRAVVHRS